MDAVALFCRLTPSGKHGAPYRTRNPNDTRETASALALSTEATFCLGVGDVDFVRFPTPTGGSGGGTVQWQFTQVATAPSLAVDATAASVNGLLTSASFAGCPTADGKEATADHLTRPYSITVSQP